MAFVVDKYKTYQKTLRIIGNSESNLISQIFFHSLKVIPACVLLRESTLNQIDWSAGRQRREGIQLCSFIV